MTYNIVFNGLTAQDLSDLFVKCLQGDDGDNGVCRFEFAGDDGGCVNLANKMAERLVNGGEVVIVDYFARGECHDEFFKGKVIDDEWGDVAYAVTYSKLLDVVNSLSKDKKLRIVDFFRNIDVKDYDDGCDIMQYFLFGRLYA